MWIAPTEQGIASNNWLDCISNVINALLVINPMSLATSLPGVNKESAGGLRA